MTFPAWCTGRNKVGHEQRATESQKNISGKRGGLGRGGVREWSGVKLGAGKLRCQGATFAAPRHRATTPHEAVADSDPAGTNF